MGDAPLSVLTASSAPAATLTAASAPLAALTASAAPAGALTAAVSPLGVLTASDMAGMMATLNLLAATPVAGFALQNGTPAILTWTAPNDGQLHRVIVAQTAHCTSAGTGGRVNVNGTAPDGSALAVQALAANQGTGTTANLVTILVQAGTTVTLAQFSALTAGAVTAWFELWGS